jgi:hypothetical protein
MSSNTQWFVVIGGLEDYDGYDGAYPVEAENADQAVDKAADIVLAQPAAGKWDRFVPQYVIQCGAAQPHVVRAEPHNQTWATTRNKGESTR